MDNITQFFTTVSSWAVAITAIIAALTAVIKPLRQAVSKLFGIRKGTDEIKKELSGIKTDLVTVKDDISHIKEDGHRRDSDMHEMKIDIRDMRNDLTEQIEKVSFENDENERSRIRRDVMKFGMIARKKQPITEREFESLRLDYEKYHGPLHGNGIVSDEFEFIKDYYNKNYVNWM